VTPNGITLTNIIVRILMIFLAWAQNERPTPFSGGELVGRACVIAFLFFLSEVLDDLDGMHARQTKRGSKFGEVFDHTVDAFGTPLLMATVGMSSQVGMCALAFSVVGGLSNQASERRSRDFTKTPDDGDLVVPSSTESSFNLSELKGILSSNATLVVVTSDRALFVVD